MKINQSTWVLFSGLALFGLLIWGHFSYPQLAFTNFTIDRAQARTIARNYLTEELHVDLTPFHEAIVFHTDEEANRFLQRVMGFQGLSKFLKEQDYDLFYWVVRFFKEGEKEEFHVLISSATGEIISFRHIVDEMLATRTIDREEAKAKAIAFLRQRYGFDPSNYLIRGDLEHNLDNRSDFQFSWQRRGVAINWSNKPEDGFGKMLTSIKVSGDEVWSFTKSAFVVPDEFERQIELLRNTGNNLSTVIRVIYFLLFFAAMYVMLVRRNHLAMHTTKRFYVWLAVAFFILTASDLFLQYQATIFEYKTSTPMLDYLLRMGINALFYSVIGSIMLLMPSLAGELLHFEESRERKEGAMLHFLRTSFFSRQVAAMVALGYLVCLMMLGIQTGLIEIGQRYWGVWREYTWLSHLTSASAPLLAGFAVSFKAAFLEEISFRLFSLTLVKKLLKSTFWAVIFVSLFWGFGHAGYAVFPMWFRGVEVTMLGFFLAFIYLRFGLIPVLVAHYLFDAFWGTAPYLLGQSTPAYFFSSIILLLIPAFFGLTAYAMNREVPERPLQWLFNIHQKYNLNILKEYLRIHWDHFGRLERGAVLHELHSHYWDLAVAETALDELYKEKGRPT